MRARDPGAARFLATLFRLPPRLLPIALSGQCLLDTEFLSGLQVKGVPFDFPDDVFQQYLLLEPAKCVLQRLAFLQLYFRQLAPRMLTRTSFVIPI